MCESFEPLSRRIEKVYDVEASTHTNGNNSSSSSSNANKKKRSQAWTQNNCLCETDQFQVVFFCFHCMFLLVVFVIWHLQMMTLMNRFVHTAFERETQKKPSFYPISVYTSNMTAVNWNAHATKRSMEIFSAAFPIFHAIKCVSWKKNEGIGFEQKLRKFIRASWQKVWWNQHNLTLGIWLRNIWNTHMIWLQSCACYPRVYVYVWGS